MLTLVTRIVDSPDIKMVTKCYGVDIIGFKDNYELKQTPERKKADRRN